MLGEMNIVEQDNFIALNISGETLPFNIIREKLFELSSVARGSKKNILIIREEAPVHIGSPLELFKYAEHFDPEFDQKIALVYPEKMQTTELKTLEVSTKNKELRFKLFSTKEEAVKWLKNN
jgi:hypothetical protein